MFQANGLINFFKLIGFFKLMVKSMLRISQDLAKKDLLYQINSSINNQIYEQNLTGPAKKILLNQKNSLISSLIFVRNRMGPVKRDLLYYSRIKGFFYI